MTTLCSYCGSDKKAYFAQLRADGVKVVAQHCAACDRSIKGQPFVSMQGFDWNSLPRLGGEQAAPQQELFSNTPEYHRTGNAPIGTLAYTEGKR